MTLSPETIEHPGAIEPEVFSSVAYLHDGTLEGLLCAVFETYARHENPEDIVRESAFTPRLGQNAVFIPTDLDHALRVKRGIERTGGKRLFNWIRVASVSDRADIGSLINIFIHHIMNEGNKRECAKCTKAQRCRAARKTSVACPRIAARLVADISHPAVSPIYREMKAMMTEREHMLQFIRFNQLEGDIWYAKCNPKGSVIPLLMNHFAGRLNVQSFIIYDEVHHIAGVYDGKEWCLVDTTVTGSPEDNLPDRTRDDAMMTQSWKRFYKAVAIDSRYNPELRRRFMPVRFWKNLPEMEDSLPTELRRTRE